MEKYIATNIPSKDNSKVNKGKSHLIHSSSLIPEITAIRTMIIICTERLEYLA